MIWFTSDTHFNHSNIIRYSNRPFSNVLEHDEELIKRWNYKVKKNDIIYHLGDFGFGGRQKLCSILSRLNGKIFLIKGNHDKCIMKPEIKKFFAEISESKTIHYKKKLFFLSHYAHRVWDRSYYGSIHLYGHSHGKLEPYKKSLDVGVDAWGYYPVAINEILYLFEI